MVKIRETRDLVGPRLRVVLTSALTGLSLGGGVFFALYVGHDTVSPNGVSDEYSHHTVDSSG